MSAPGSAALSAVGLTRRFGAFTAVEDVTLHLPRGARHAVIGPNGAGKTTLVNLLTGVLRPSAGGVQIGGADVSALPQHLRVRRGLSRTFQLNTSFGGLSVQENLLLAVLERDRLSGNFWSSLRRFRRQEEEARALLDTVNLAGDAAAIARTLPYGKQRLLEIGLALASRPEILLLDEPAAGVPSSDSGVIFERLAALPRSLSILFIEHDMSLVMRFAERVTVMVAGRVLVEGTPAEIMADSRVRDVYLGRAGHAGH